MSLYDKKRTTKNLVKLILMKLLLIVLLILLS